MPDALRVPSVLFVCIENSCRSQIAEGFARALGAGRIEASSAGSRPSGRVSSRAEIFMQEKGIDIRGQSSKGLDDLPAGIEWDYVVTMGCGDACPNQPARNRIEWDLPDPKDLPDEEFRRVRDAIERQVRALIEEAAVRR